MQIQVIASDANNILCQVTPTPAQTITIDRGVAGNGIVSIVPVTIATFQYLRITYTNGTVSDVGPLTSTAYAATAPINITGNTISLLTVPIASGGTGAITAAAAIENLLPSYTGNGNKRLGLNSGATALEWVADGGGTVTSVDFSGGTTGLTATGGPITTSGTFTLAGTLAIANGGSGATTAQAAINAFAGAVTAGYYLRGDGTNVLMSGIQAADVPTLNQNTTGTAANITATSNSTLITLSSLSLPGSQVSGNISGNAANVTGTVAIANGGTGQTTANAALNALLPAQTGNSGKYLTTDGTNTSWATNPLGTVTSVSGTGTVSGLTLTGTVTTSGSLTLGGTLDLSAYNGAGAFTTLSASGAVTLSGGTANGVAYLNGSKVLTTGSALTFDGTNLGIGGAASMYWSGANKGLAITGSTNGAEIDLKITGGSSTSYLLQDLSSNLRFGNQGNFPIIFNVSDTEQMRLTSTGLGIGTSSIFSKLNIQNATARIEFAETSGSNYIESLNNARTSTAGFRIYGSEFKVFTGAAGAYGDRLTVDTSGNLGLGVTPSAWDSNSKAIQLRNSGGLYDLSFGGVSTYTFLSNNAYRSSGGTDRYLNTYGASNYMQNNGAHAWFTAPSGTAGNAITFTQAMTLGPDGTLLLGTTTQQGFLTVQCPSANQNSLNVICSNTSGPNYVLNLQSDASVANTAYLIRGFTNSTGVFFVAGNGNVTNTNNSYGAISDAKLKENITDATPKLEKLNQVRIVNFNMRGDEQKQLGVIAQELEQVFPGMVEETIDRDKDGNDLGTTTKSVKYSVFVPMLIKAMQEQQAIITALTARVAALESN